MENLFTKPNFYINKFLLIAFILCWTAISQLTNAQVIYTDVIPDSIKSNNSTLTIDLDNNGTGDFLIESQIISSLGYVSLKAGVLGTSNAVIGYPSTSAAYALNYGDTISPNSNTWKVMGTANQQMAGYAGGTAGGDWPGVGDRYLGFKFFIGSDIHYGWARMNVSSTSVMYTLYDYAYESTANTMILAGHKGLAGINENKNQQEFFVFPNPANEKVTLNFPANTNIQKIEVLDIQGRAVENFTPDLTAEKLTLNISGLSAGIYYIKVNDSDFRQYKKLVVVK